MKINDQLISVNSQSVTNMSNREAMEALKKELRQAEPNIKISSIKLVSEIMNRIIYVCNATIITSTIIIIIIIILLSMSMGIV